MMDGRPLIRRIEDLKGHLLTSFGDDWRKLELLEEWIDAKISLAIAKTYGETRK